MVHTIHIIENGVVHKLEHIPDDATKEMLNWWVTPPNDKGMIPEYFIKVIKDGDVLKRAIALSRSNIAAMDIVPEDEPRKATLPTPA